MSKVVNLRTARKQKARERDRQAALRTTQPGAEAARLRAEAALERARLDGHRRDDSEPDAER